MYQTERYYGITKYAGFSLSDAYKDGGGAELA